MYIIILFNSFFQPESLKKKYPFLDKGKGWSIISIADSNLKETIKKKDIFSSGSLFNSTIKDSFNDFLKEFQNKES
jgi:hypothetical protein